MSNYEDFEFIKTIKDFNEVVIVRKNRTHFHSICINNSYNLEVIKHCIEHGADLNFKDIYNDTPFHWSCCNIITKEVLEYCLENGADLTIKNVDGDTPFVTICEYHESFIPICKPYINEYDYIKTLKKCNLNWKEYV